MIDPSIHKENTKTENIISVSVVYGIITVCLFWGKFFILENYLKSNLKSDLDIMTMVEYFGVLVIVLLWLITIKIRNRNTIIYSNDKVQSEDKKDLTQTLNITFKTNVKITNKNNIKYILIVNTIILFIIFIFVI